MGGRGEEGEGEGVGRVGEGGGGWWFLTQEFHFLVMAGVGKGRERGNIRKGSIQKSSTHLVHK